MGLTLAKPGQHPDSPRMLRRTIASLWFSLLCLPLYAETVVFAAASLKEPLDALAMQQDGVVVSYGGSGTIARQVMQGAPADIVVLANTAWMEALDNNGAIDPKTIKDVASNRLVLISHKDIGEMPLDVNAINIARDGGPIAMGLTDAVPAGVYARSAFETLGLWDDLRGHVAELDSVRGALALVARGQAPLGVVYATDAEASDTVYVASKIPPTAHPTIRYQGAMTSEADIEASAFWELLTGPVGQGAFLDAGFLPALRDAP